MTRFSIAYSRPMSFLLGALGLGPRGAWVDVDDVRIEVRMGWAFWARFPRESVRSAARSDRLVISQGVHGRNGRWLVNGSARGLVRMDLTAGQTARVVGRSVPLSALEVSMEDPDGLLRTLSTRSGTVSP